MATINDTETGDTKRLIIVDQPATNTSQRPHRSAGRYIEPDFTKIVDGVREVTLGTRGLRQRQYWRSRGQIEATVTSSSRVEMTDARLGKSEADKK